MGGLLLLVLLLLLLSLLLLLLLYLLLLPLLLPAFGISGVCCGNGPSCFCWRFRAASRRVGLTVFPPRDSIGPRIGHWPRAWSCGRCWKRHTLATSTGDRILSQKHCRRV